jgi:uncharacterized protein YqcC (DUF446 family)
MTETAPKRTFFPKHVSWLTIVLAALAGITFYIIAAPGTPYAIPMGGGVMEYGNSVTTAVPPATAPDMPMRDTSVGYGGGVSSQGTAGSAMMPYPYPYPYPSPDVPVTDTREFLKTYYNASLYTRDVQALTRRVETTVRGYDGRIDSESSNPKSGYVSFAIPQSKYDAFRNELEGMVDSRFLTVNISSQNLLPQKQSIEEQQKQADTALSGYQAARKQLVSAHASAVASLQSKIDADNQQIASLSAQPSTPQIQIQLQAVTADLASLKAQLTNENASYTSQLSNADANIKYATDWQTAVKTQDQTLLDNVATVSGTVSLQWISLWDMARLYLPGYWIPAIFAVLAYLSYLWDRRRFRLSA